MRHMQAGTSPLAFSHNLIFVESGLAKCFGEKAFLSEDVHKVFHGATCVGRVKLIKMHAGIELTRKLAELKRQGQGLQKPCPHLVGLR